MFFFKSQGWVGGSSFSCFIYCYFSFQIFWPNLSFEGVGELFWTRLPFLGWFWSLWEHPVDKLANNEVQAATSRGQNWLEGGIQVNWWLVGGFKLHFLSVGSFPALTLKSAGRVSFRSPTLRMPPCAALSFSSQEPFSGGRLTFNTHLIFIIEVGAQRAPRLLVWYN